MLHLQGEDAAPEPGEEETVLRHIWRERRAMLIASVEHQSPKWCRREAEGGGGMLNTNVAQPRAGDQCPGG